ncbi:DinB family protein [Pedobacter sp. AW1-32]|uniref:DinB family protein n=1 Tax=Pedobacter sp. AW1-32 TaxID=3383026 RepID=UPI003FEF2B06
MSIADLLLMEMHNMETTKQNNMEIINLLKKEFEQEAAITQKFLPLVPLDQADWAPHEKSMKLGALATHLAEISGWIHLALTTEELDFAAKVYVATPIADTEALLALFQKGYHESLTELQKADERDLTGRWILRNGDQILADYSKYEMIRHSFSQTAHHRAQLGVYFRLLNIPVPSSYGPSADNYTF